MEKRTFKGIIEHDVKRAFIRVDEFADIHEIDGRKMPALLDDVEVIEREKKMKSNMDGIYVRQKLIYVSAADFGPSPAVGRALKLDGRDYLILDVTEEQGTYAITIEANRTR